MRFADALCISPGATAIIGGGGKTTLMERLAQELSASARVIVCTTTHIMPEKTMPCLVSPSAREISDALAQNSCVCVGSIVENGKFGPPELSFLELCKLADYVIVEADGAKRLPLKAHAAHEPVVPPEANQTILVAGLAGFGKPARESVHRTQLFAEALGTAQDAPVTPEAWAEFVNREALHTRVLLNQADIPGGEALARCIAAGLRTPVCAGSLQKGWVTCLY